LPDVSESDSSYQPDGLSQNSEASTSQSPPKPPPRQRGKQRKTTNEDPKKLPTPKEPVDLIDSSTELRSPVRKRSAPTKSTKARGGNTECETHVEKEPEPSTSKQPPAAPEKTPGIYILHLKNIFADKFFL
jgi:hypothetical protein